jgi:uncharacterized protein (DUF58 family)
VKAKIKHILNTVFFTKRLYIATGVVVVVFVFAFIYPWLYFIGLLGLWGLVLATALDLLMLFTNAKGIIARRSSKYNKLSNGDDNELFIEVAGNYSFRTELEIIDEIPEQFQFREFRIRRTLEAGDKHKIRYTLRPVSRGEFHFGNLLIFATSPLGFVKRRFTFDQHMMLPSYPSFLKLRQFELMAISDRLINVGIKKIRRVGQSTEFDHIREYVPGNDIRAINWKASARTRHLMVNHFTDERAQQVYSVINTGRIMQMPFEKLSLLDYAINAALVLSHIAYIKHDKPGLVTFSNTIQSAVAAERKGNQLYRLQETLYNAKTDFLETNYEVLLNFTRTRITQRSLILLYTNFETLNSLTRQIKYLKQIARNHLVVAIIFENTELHELLTQTATSTGELYRQTIAKKFDYEKQQIALELQRSKIQCVYTKPENLTVNTLNKYLELKARGMI